VRLTTDSVYICGVCVSRVSLCSLYQIAITAKKHLAANSVD